MLGTQKFGWATRLLSVVAQVATAILKLVYIPDLFYILHFLENCYFSNQSFQILWLISGMDVIKNTNFINFLPNEAHSNNKFNLRWSAPVKSKY